MHALSNRHKAWVRPVNPRRHTLRTCASRSSGAAGSGPLVYVIMGVSASGKSTVGAKLATQLGCTFIEGDDYHPHENIAKMRSGQPLTDKDREPWLQRLAAVVQDHVQQKQMAVVSCSALKCAYRTVLNGDVVDFTKCPSRQPVIAYVLLDPSRDELVDRLKQREGKHFMPLQLLDSQLEALEKDADFYLHVEETEVHSAYFEQRELEELAKQAGDRGIGKSPADSGFPDVETFVKLLSLMRQDRVALPAAA